MGSNRNITVPGMMSQLWHHGPLWQVSGSTDSGRVLMGLSHSDGGPSAGVLATYRGLRLLSLPALGSGRLMCGGKGNEPNVHNGTTGNTFSERPMLMYLYYSGRKLT